MQQKKFISIEDKTPTYISVEYDKLVSVGVQSPTEIKPPADCRAAQMYYVSKADAPLAARAPKAFLNKGMALLCALLLTVSMLGINVLAASDDPVKLTVIHMNDTHGRTQAEAYISQMAKDLKANGGNVLILDAGDRLHGQTTTNLSKGESMVNIMNEVGYSAMVPGNHDFNYGVERLTELSGMMDFPLLAANVRDANGSKLFDSHTVFEMAGMTVGVFGIVTPETISASDPRIVAGLTFEDPAQTATVMVEELNDKGCDMIIALTHLGNDNLSISANRSDALAAVPGIDVIIDGHSHTLLEDGKVVGSTLIAQTGEFAENIGIVEITDSGKKTARTIAVPNEGDDTDLVPDEAIVSKIAEEDAKIEPITLIVVGRTPVLLQGERKLVRTKETNLANLITDSMKYATDADMAFLTGGNIRGSIEAGDITMGQVLTVLPFSNLIVTVKLSGTDVLEMLEHGVSMYPEPVGQHIQVSGIKFEFDPDAEPMHRVTKVTMANGDAFDINKTFTIATIDFLAAGGDGYSMMERGINMVYYQGDAEAFAEYLATNPAMNAEPENRVMPVKAGENIDPDQRDETENTQETDEKENTKEADEKGTTYEAKEKVNQLAASDNPGTGDDSFVFPYLVIALLVSGMFITLAARRADNLH